MRPIVVTHCGECPAHESIDSRTGERCRISERPIYRDDPERPTWCPLERGDVVIRLREKVEEL